ncbi:hypothetical protein AOLI_G00194710, partial [Acnodon oligacanthus]
GITSGTSLSPPTGSATGITLGSPTSASYTPPSTGITSGTSLITPTGSPTSVSYAPPSTGITSSTSLSPPTGSATGITLGSSASVSYAPQSTGITSGTSLSPPAGSATGITPGSPTSVSYAPPSTGTTSGTSLSPPTGSSTRTTLGPLTDSSYASTSISTTSGPPLSPVTGSSTGVPAGSLVTSGPPSSPSYPTGTALKESTTFSNTPASTSVTPGLSPSSAISSTSITLGQPTASNIPASTVVTSYPPSTSPVRSTIGVTPGPTTSAGSTLVSTVATSGPPTSSPAGSNTVITQGPSTGVSVISASTGVTTKPTSSLSPTAVASTTAASDVKQISFTSNETFISDLLNSSSAAFLQRSEKVKSQLEPVFKATFTTFIKLMVISFKEGSIITLMNLEFSSGSAPNDTAVVNTVLTAKTSLNITAASVITTTTSTTQIPTLLTSTSTTTTQVPTTATTATTATTTPIATTATTTLTTASPTTTTTTTTTTATTTTTTAATTTPAPTRPPPAVALQIVIQQVYVEELSNPQSEQFQSLASVVVVSFDKIYKLQYGILFVRTVVKAFRPGTTRAQNVEADVQLIFNENSTKPIPAATDIVSTLKEAISNPNSGFALSVDPTSITVVSSPQIVTVVIFTNGTFVTDLSNSTSALFTTRSSMIKTGIEPFFTADYPAAFSSLALTNFSDGGYSSTFVRMIQNSMDLSFGASATRPNTTQIGQTIIRAAKNNSLPFQIFTSKIIVNGTVISSSEVSSKISMFTATFMVAISLLVTWSS